MIIPGKGFDHVLFSSPFWSRQLSRLIDADRELQPHERGLLVRGLQKPELFGEIQRLDFLLFKVCLRSEDSYARTCAERLASGVKRFGEMKAYLEGKIPVLPQEPEEMASAERVAKSVEIGGFASMEGGTGARAVEPAPASVRQPPQPLPQTKKMQGVIECFIAAQAALAAVR